MIQLNIIGINLGSLLILFGIVCCQPKEKESVTEAKPATRTKMEGKYLFTGTYTKKEGHVDGKANGFLISRIRSDNSIEPVYTETNSINPSFLTLSGDGRYLYVVNETGADVDTVGSVSAFRVDQKSGKTMKINSQPSYGLAPCYITTDKQNRLAMITNYVGGVVVVYPITSDGSLEVASQVIRLEGKGPSESRQEASHPHSINLSPEGKYAYVADLGTDKIMIYKVDYERKKLIATDPGFVLLTPGSGPRHMVFSPTKPLVYVITELRNTIVALKYNAATGALTPFQTISTLPGDFEGESWTADIHISEDGNYLFGSNRGHNSIVSYIINRDGSLTLLGFESTRGEFPRNFVIDGSNLYVANQNSNNIILFRIRLNGNLQFVREYQSATPVCLKVFEY